MARQTRYPEQPQWDQPEYVCPFCPEVEPFQPHEGRRRDRHLPEVHRQMIMWSCPYCPMRKSSNRFDDLRGHVRVIHFHGQPLHPPKTSFEWLDWREEERRKGPDDDQKERTRTRRFEKRTRSPQGVTPPSKVVKRDS